ncbi:MAG: hypothetical protein ACRDSF_18465 [Pseudonocardiaceae bacterium]
MSSIPHRTWCDLSECYTEDLDGVTIHLSGETTFVTMCDQLGVQLIETDNGIEVQIKLYGCLAPFHLATFHSAVLIPEMAAQLGEALLDHAERATGQGGGPGRPGSSPCHLPDTASLG